MKIDVVRTTFNKDSTVGEMMLDGEHECWTLEDTVRPAGIKIYGETAIPYGTYRVLVTHSTRFNRDLPLLLNIPGFEGIRIHPGNTAADTHGCILVGGEKTATSVLYSRFAFDQLFNKIRNAIRNGEEVWLTVKTGEA